MKLSEAPLLTRISRKVAGRKRELAVLAAAGIIPNLGAEDRDRDG